MEEVYLDAPFRSNLPRGQGLTEAFDSASVRPKLADGTKKGAGKIRTPLQHAKENGPPTTN